MRIIILIVLVISGLTAVACSGEAPPPADTQTASRPTADVPATVEAGIRSTREAETAVDATVEAKVAAALTTSTSAPGPTNTPAATTLSLDEYLTLCASTEQELADDATYGDLSSELAAEADRFEALTPPTQLSEWHLLNIENYRTIQAVLDSYPKDDVTDLANLMLIAAAAADLEEELGEVVVRLPEDVLQQMIDAGCIDPDLVPYDQADSSDEDAVGVASDRAALVALHNATEGGSWRNSTNWLTSSPLHEWHGVTTRSDGRVIALNLETNSLRGTLPAALGDLTNLEILQLYNNAISGQIPAQLGNLTNLRELNLGSGGYSRLTGPIPAALGDLTNLESLVLNNNELSGPIPATLGHLNNLRELDLWSNNLTGPVPAWLYDLPNLEYLSLGWNELTGPIPGWLGDLSNLEWLLLTNSELTGTIPAELGDLSNLKVLDLSFNQLTGPIPAELGDLSSLEFLDLGTNRLMGPIPAELSNLANLSELQLLGNQLTGCVPVGLRDVAEENDLGELGLPDCGLEGRPTAGSFVYDSDGDGLIEVANLEQLDAIRWDLDGDGSPVSNATGYNAAFPNAVAGMGCPDSECSGYELILDLDFDTNGNGRADAGDDYWNDGEGWAPIGGDFDAAFESSFNGGGHTISNLYIDRRDAEYTGLFGRTRFGGGNVWVGLNNNISDLALVNVDVQGGTNTGGLAGSNGLVVAACSVTGVVGGGGDVGGLVGNNFSGQVIASYSAASVADGSDTGGLVGSNFSGTIIASYSIGSVSDYNGVSGFVDVGGLVGSNFADRGTTRDSYWDTQTSGQTESAGGEGKTTSELQSPTGYTGIYENWNVDLDEDGVGDDLWDFGDASQYPTLWHGS